MELKQLLNLRAEQRADMMNRMVRHEVFTIMARVKGAWYCLHHDAEVPGKDKEGTFKTKGDARAAADMLKAYPEVQEVVILEVVATERWSTEAV